MKLVIVTAIHKRYDLTYAFLVAMERIRKEFGIETYAVVTENDDCVDLLREFQVYYKEHENLPKGKKFNYGVDMLREVDFTHMMILGSDDVVSSRFMEVSLAQDPNNEYDIIGTNGLWFWGMNSRRAGFNRFGYFPVKGVLAGPGKMVSKRALEAVDYAPWPDDCGGGMDAKMMQKTRNAMRDKGMIPKLKKYSILDGGGFMVDIKYEQHISSLSPILRREAEEFGEYRYEEQDPHEVIPNHLPDIESEYLFRLLEKEKERWEEVKASK